jgi:signal transduction histidine kinase
VEHLERNGKLCGRAVGDNDSEEGETNFQESLTNVAKHSQATKVKVVIERTCDELVISVKDTGTGITAENLAAFHSFGILGMKERAEMLGGALNVTRPPEGGTLVVVQLPENGF